MQPAAFCPERFAPGRLTDDQRLTYLPFSYGERRCLGASLAVTEIVTMLAVAGQRVRLRLAGQRPVVVPAVTQRPGRRHQDAGGGPVSGVLADGGAGMSPLYGTVDVTDDGQVGEYERTFYQSYAGLTDNKLVRLIWDWDDERQRARTKIPYADQVIYSERDADGKLTGAMAVNLNWPDAFQGQAFGFAVPDRLNGLGSPAAGAARSSTSC